MKTPDNYKLISNHKVYTLDQDKAINPTATYTKTFEQLRSAFPEIPHKLVTIKQNSGYYVYDFTDGYFNQHGKGATEAQAKASAIMEYSERFSWLNFDYKHASGYQHCSINKLSKHHDLSMQARGISEHFATTPHSEEIISIINNTPVDWIDAYSLTRNKMIPYPLNYNNMTNTSNGICTGNTKEEAIVQGICENIERHHTTYLMTHLEDAPPIFVEPSSIQDEVTQSLIDHLEQIGITIHLLYMSKVFEVPSFICCGIDKAPNKEIVRVGYGYGCHTSPYKAMIRAITEYIQGREGMANDNRIPENLNFLTGQWQFRLNLPINRLIQTCKRINASEIKDISKNDFLEEIKLLTDIISKKGFEVAIIDKTHPKLKIPVYRVYTPGFNTISGWSTLNAIFYGLPIHLYMHAGMKKEAAKYLDTYRKEIARENEPFLEISTRLKLTMAGVSESMQALAIHFERKSFPQRINIDLYPARTYLEDLRRHLDQALLRKQQEKSLFSTNGD